MPKSIYSTSRGVLNVLDTNEMYLVLNWKKNDFTRHEVPSKLG